MEDYREDRTAQIAGYTWPRVKRAAKAVAGAEGCTLSDYLHQLVVADLYRRNVLEPTENNGSAARGDAAAAGTR